MPIGIKLLFLLQEWSPDLVLPRRGYTRKDTRKNRWTHKLWSWIGSIGLFFLSFVFSQMRSLLVSLTQGDQEAVQAFLLLLLCAAGVIGIQKILQFWILCGYRIRVTYKHYGRLFRDRWLLFALVGVDLIATTTTVIYLHKCGNGNYVVPVASAGLLGVICIFVLWGCITTFAQARFRPLLETLARDNGEQFLRLNAHITNDTEFRSELLDRIHDADFVCFSAVHFAELFDTNACKDNWSFLESLQATNAKAAFFYMPQFPFCWHIYERAVLVGLDHKDDYVAPLVTSIASAKRRLNASIRLRHWPEEFRMILWGQMQVPEEVNVSSPAKITEYLEGADPPRIATQVTDGGMILQPYTQGQQGRETPRYWGNLQAWGCMLPGMVQWFFNEWRSATPTDLQSVQRQNKLGIVATSLGISKRSWSYDSRADTGLNKLTHNKRLDSFYSGIQIELKNQADKDRQK